MFTVSYDEFVDYSFYSDYKVSFMPGMTVKQAVSTSAKVSLNVDTKVAYVYCD